MWIKKQDIKFEVFMKILTLQMNDYHFGINYCVTYMINGCTASIMEVIVNNNH